MAFFRRNKNKPKNEERNNQNLPDLENVSDEDFWSAAQSYIADDNNEKTFGEDIVETLGMSEYEVMSSAAADNVRFRVVEQGFLEVQVNDYVEDTVESLKYYEDLVTKLHKENEALNEQVNHLRSMIEVFRVQGRVDMDDETAEMIKQVPKGDTVKNFFSDDNDMFTDSPFGNADDDTPFPSGDDDTIHNNHDAHQYRVQSAPRPLRNPSLNSSSLDGKPADLSSAHRSTIVQTKDKHDMTSDDNPFGVDENYDIDFPASLDDE